MSELTMTKTTFEHPASPVLDKILDAICLHHTNRRIIEYFGQTKTVITIDCDSRDGGRVIGANGWVIKNIIVMIQAIGKAQSIETKLELYVPPKGKREPALEYVDPDYNHYPIRMQVAEVIGLLTGGKFIIDEIKTINSVTITVQLSEPMDAGIKYAINAVFHTAAKAKGCPRLTVSFN